MAIRRRSIAVAAEVAVTVAMARVVAEATVVGIELA